MSLGGRKHSSFVPPPIPSPVHRPTQQIRSLFFGEPFDCVIHGARGAVLAVPLRTDEPLTGRQIHGIVGDDYSLWSVQETLKTLAQLGLVETRTFGRAGVHTINEAHASTAPLHALVDPIAALTSAIIEVIDAQVEAVLLFGSISRGEAAADSDIDLAVIAAPDWGGRTELEDVVRARLGNDCDVLVFTPVELSRLVAADEPVVGDILRNGVALVASKPRGEEGAA